ncbi:MAG: AAA family ATPase [candidate division Zixibacteria bacterium]|nr:AAA family ATPase [candidate division Zixibacteria bacterium]
MAPEEMTAKNKRILVIGRQDYSELEVKDPKARSNSDPSAPSESVLKLVRQPIKAGLVAIVAGQVVGEKNVKIAASGWAKRRVSCQTVKLVPVQGDKGPKVLRVTATRELPNSPNRRSRKDAGAHTKLNDNSVVVIYDNKREVDNIVNLKAVSSLIKKNPKAIFIYRPNSPADQGDILEMLRKQSNKRLLLVLEAEELRSVGMNISRQLSWERTAKDLCWQLNHFSWTDTFDKCAGVIVRIDLDGALLFRKGRSLRAAKLIYDQRGLEEDFQREHSGSVTGIDEAFVGCLAAGIAGSKKAALDTIIKNALSSVRYLHIAGFGNDPLDCELQLSALNRNDTLDDETLRQTSVKVSTSNESPDPKYWQMATRLEDTGFVSSAIYYVKFGRDYYLEQLPVGSFGNLTTYDRGEIEDYRSVFNLMYDYIKTTSLSTPLSIAVFGPPGSGKSFGVTQIANSIEPGKIKKLEFNLSQFSSTNDLAAAFHIVRDVALSGKIPLVFFDEFDSEFEGSLGWLKYFLSPMQDGVFRDQQLIHSIGRSILVFAGGTSSRLEKFGEKNAVKKLKEAQLQFIKAKGIDFLSRLRGYINIKGPDPIDDGSHFVIRRAPILRSQLKINAPQLLNSLDYIDIDDNVLRALLLVPKYKHGVRSMEAIIKMSRLVGRNRFDQSALPSSDQLKLHVNPKQLERFVRMITFAKSASEELARAIHEKYREDRKKNHPSDDPAMKPWRNLDEKLKLSNRAQADDIPVKLQAIGYELVRCKRRKPKLVRFRKAQINKMARMEHARWNRERWAAGWRLGEIRSVKKKISPYLVEWDELPDNIKKYDIDAVKAIPKILASAGFEVRKLK